MDAPNTSRPAIEAFCKVVCGFVRFWPDHAAITAELTAHLEDHRDTLLELRPGLTPEEAEAAAVQAMGDPETLGRALDESHSHRFGWFQILFRVSVRTSLVLLLLFFFLPINFDDLANTLNPPLYNDGTNAIIEAYDQTEILADYHPEDAVCYLDHYTFTVERVLVTPRPHTFTGEPTLRVSILLKAVNLDPRLCMPRVYNWLWTEDDLGNRYPAMDQYEAAEVLFALYPEQASAPQLYNTMGGPSLTTPFVTYYDLYVIDVDPDAAQLTLRFDRYGNAQLSFPLFLKGDVENG